MKKIATILALVAVIGLISTFLFFDDFDVTITEAQAQAAADKKIQTGAVEHLGIELDVNTLTIDFRENNSAFFNLDADVSGFGFGGQIVASGASGIDYRSPKIYLANPDFKSMNFGMNEDTDEKTRDLRNVASDFLKRQRDEALSDDARESLDRLMTGENSVAKERVKQTVQWFFSTIPVYDLNNAGVKGSLASLALKDVTFSEDKAVITLSPRQAIIKIVQFILLLLLGTAWVIFSYGPTWTAKKLMNKPEINGSEDQ